ncbi:EF-hand domain-containing protein [Verrucomicrobiota bacterium]
MNKMIMLLVAATVVCSADSALAEGKSHQGKGKAFARADKNKDGKLTKDEFIAFKKKGTKRQHVKKTGSEDGWEAAFVKKQKRLNKLFNAQDVDGDGTLNKEEFATKPQKNGKKRAK